MGAIGFAGKAFGVEMKGVPLLQFSPWGRNEGGLEVVKIQVCIAALEELLHCFLPGPFSEHPPVYLLESVVLVDCIALFVAVLAEVEVLAVLAVVPDVDDGLDLAVVALVVGEHVARLANLFSEVFL